MLCNLCRKKTNLVKSHILPKSFYKPALETGTLYIISQNSNSYLKKSPSGIYDPEIMCLDCERLFSPWDDYANQILLKNEIPFYPENQIYKIPIFNYKRLKMFFISLLWRAGASNSQFYKRIELGPYLEMLRKMILFNKPGEPEEFAIFLTRFDRESKIPHTEPYSTRLKNIRFYRFFIADYEAYIKVDQMKTPYPFNFVILKPEGPLQILQREWIKNPDLKILKELRKRIPLKK